MAARKTKRTLGPARNARSVKAWLNRTVDPALDFHVDRVTKVRGVTRVRAKGRPACVVVTANVVIDGVATGVRVRRCGRDYDAQIVGRK